MKFKPLTDSYKFSSEVLTELFPSYLKKPIQNWLQQLLLKKGKIRRSRFKPFDPMDSDFVDALQINFREVFPRSWSELSSFVFEDDEMAANFIAFCLQIYTDERHAEKLEKILSIGGSGFKVINEDENTTGYGDFNLVKRVSELVKNSSVKAISENNLLKKAWDYCYSRNPDYERVVSSSCDFLEGFLGKKYFPDDTGPQLVKFCYALEKNPEKLSYKGDSIVEPKNLITNLVVKATNIRGQHTEGQGRVPTKEEAEFILHTTILIWNLHQD